MKNIFYLSNAHYNLFPSNTRSNFYSYIDINDLEYLPDDDIEATIKSLTFDNGRDEDLAKDELLAIRSNISEFTIRNGEYDRVISPLHSVKSEKGIVHVDFKNPIFFSTRKELLSRAWFQIINLDTNNHPNFKAGSPTFIQVVVRKKYSKMKKPFSIFLDSSCSKSKKSYPQNNNMEFSIELPERMDFRTNWHVTLKSLFITNNLFNVNSCEYGYFRFRYGHLTHGWRRPLKDGNYQSLSEIVKLLEESFQKNGVDLFVRESSGYISFNMKRELYKEEEIHIVFNPHLSHLLGFHPFIEEDQLHIFSNTEKEEWKGKYPINILSLIPKNLVVCCDIVDDTIFGGQHVKLIRLVNTNNTSTSDMLAFDFLQNEYVELGVKEFGSIKIRIADVSGQTVKCDPTIPTRLQLMFLNV